MEIKPKKVKDDSSVSSEKNTKTFEFLTPRLNNTFLKQKKLIFLLALCIIY